MVDNNSRYHRPRTTRRLAHRAEDAARAAGGDPANHHEAVRLAVNYLALAAGGPLACPHCDEGNLEAHRDGYFRCDRGECVASVTGNSRVPWYRAVGLPSGTDVSDPRQSDGTNNRISTSFGGSQNPFQR